MKKRTKKYTWITVGTLLGLALIGWVATAVDSDKTPAAASSLGSLVVAENDYDFGTISMKDGEVEHEFKLTNNGGEPVTIKEVYTSCMCTTAEITDADGKTYGLFGMPGHGLSKKTKVTIAPDQSVVVSAIYDPAAHGPSGVGLADRTIYVETNSTETPTIELEFTAMVRR